jgi:hypothetical protein
MTVHTRERERRVAFAIALTTILAPVFGWLYAGGWGAFCALAVWGVFVTLPRTAGVRLLEFLYGFVTPENLPLTMVNVVLAIVVGSMTFGIDVAFYAALIGVPVVLLTLTVVALDPGEVDPEEIASATVEDAQPVRIRSGRRR